MIICWLIKWASLWMFILFKCQKKISWHAIPWICILFRSQNYQLLSSKCGNKSVFKIPNSNFYWSTYRSIQDSQQKNTSSAKPISAWWLLIALLYNYAEKNIMLKKTPFHVNSCAADTICYLTCMFIASQPIIYILYTS